ncbi:MAG: oxygen-independent coproporphyrinogen III oxidase [Chitinophagaceae bacterium]|nr:MAG: oxygen-independent coproporphyrinogen III oxidase [Chitinophagaceae bacterium]
MLSLLQKYDLPTPRYTSYPTVPYWDFGTLTEASWKETVVNTFLEENGELCIYIHLPFCENMCTFCACNKRITVNHAVEDPYISSVLKEWAMYRSLLPATPVIREIHLGGGTPTFFSPDNLEQLIKGITKDAIVKDDHEFSIEVHPNYTTEEHIKRLASVGFNRISLGVQDFDPKVQFVINRIQSFEKTKEVVNWARKYQYTSINIDLVYGLPHQTVRSVEHTVELIKTLMPDRIAFYSYAHVPWKSKVQRRYSEADLPAAADKWAMYSRGRELLEEAGFQPIGMDHFALANDKLFTAAREGKLHRNFMGYTTTRSKLIIGLGVSSISDAWYGFAQNEKEVEAYEAKISQGILPLVHGHQLSEEDTVIRRKILELMCENETVLDHPVLDPAFIEAAFDKLMLLEADELVKVSGRKIQVTEKGRSFIRIISAAMDAYLWRNHSGANTFSKAI